MDKIKLSIILPAYNEAKKIKNSFLQLEKFFSQKNYEMEYIFVEDGSSDETLEILKETERTHANVRLFINKRNMGKGASIKRGMLEAKGDYALFMDIDMSTPLETFNEFERYLKDYDIIIGSRWLRESNVRIPQPGYRRFMGFIFYLIVKFFFLKNIIDCNCGFKCYTRESARDIFSNQVVRRWGFDVELLYIAQKRKYRIKEVAVEWAHSRDSKVRAFVVPAITLMELAKIKYNDWKGRYER